MSRRPDTGPLPFVGAFPTPVYFVNDNDLLFIVDAVDDPIRTDTNAVHFAPPVFGLLLAWGCVPGHQWLLLLADSSHCAPGRVAFRLVC